MKKITLGLTTQYYLIFWLPVIFLFTILIYFTLTLIHYPIKSEIRLPEEYKLFMDILQRERKIPTPPKEIEADLKENPFIASTPVQRELVKAEPKREQILKLTTIISHDKKICIINQKPYREGDKIGDIKIAKIGDYYVELLLPSKRKVFLEVGSTYIFGE